MYKLNLTWHTFPTSVETIVCEMNKVGRQFAKKDF